jgi:hypothetical protein
MLSVVPERMIVPPSLIRRSLRDTEAGLADSPSRHPNLPFHPRIKELGFDFSLLRREAK